MLRRHVCADARVRNDTGNRCVVDDRATAGAKHVFNFILHREKRALQIDGDNLIERRFFNVREQTSCGQNTGVVERAVQSTVGFDRGRYKIFYVARVAHISLHKKSLASLLLDHFHRLPTRRIDIAHDNLRALPREEKRGSAAYAAAAASNERNLTRKIEWILAHALVEDLIRFRT